jgi:hypothetical protein
LRLSEQRSLQGKFAGDVALHRAAVADGEATVDFESAMRDTLLEAELTGFWRGTLAAAPGDVE